MGCTQEYKSWLSLFHLADNCSFGNEGTIVGLTTIVSLAVALLVIWLSFAMFEAGKDDALVGIRKKLVGKWDIEAMGADGKPWNGTGTFEIEKEYRKLRLIMEIPSRPPYASTTLNIYDISINPRRDPMTINYFVDDKFQIEDGHEEARLFVTKLAWVVTEDKELLQGIWYDLMPPSDQSLRAGHLKFSRARKSSSGFSNTMRSISSRLSLSAPAEARDRQRQQGHRWLLLLCHWRRFSGRGP